MAEFNRLAEEEGREPIGDENTMLLRQLMAHGEGGVKASKRVRQPMVTAVNRRDRKSMADVIVACGRKRKLEERWSLAKDVIMGDQWMVELGSGDMESKWEYLAEGRGADAHLRGQVYVQDHAERVGGLGREFATRVVQQIRHNGGRGDVVVSTETILTGTKRTTRVSKTM